MSNNRSAIIALHQLGKRNCAIARTLGVAPETVSRTIKRYKELGHDGDRPRSGRKRTANTSRNRQVIKLRVDRNPRVSMRKIARETGINREAVRRIAKKELNLTPYKLQKGQLLTDENKRVRLQRCRQLLQRHATQNWEKIVFTDEKVFTVEQAHNPQNDRIWSTEAPGPSSVVEHRQNPKSVMVWGGICASGKTPLVFVDQGVKINQEVYRRDILEAAVFPWAQQHFGEGEWTFQQDSAPELHSHLQLLIKKILWFHLIVRKITLSVKKEMWTFPQRQQIVRRKQIRIGSYYFSKKQLQWE